MNQSSLNKIVDVQGLSLALAKTKADYMHYANITGALAVNVTYNSTTDTYSADRTYNEIVARINNRGYVYAIYNGTIFELSYFYDGNIGFATAFSLDTDDRFMGASSFSIDSSNTINFDEHNDSYLSSVNLNGSANTFPQFYAPTTAGTSGQVLTSSGSGAPTWSNISTPTAATATPLMDGTAAVGSSSKYAKEDHVHPSDTTKANASDVLTKTNTTSYTPSANYHPATKKYVDDSISGFSSSLSGLTDTTISSPTNGQVLSYDTSTSKWKNATISTGVTYTLSMTNNVITLTGSNGSTSSVTLPVYGGEVDEVLG